MRVALVHDWLTGMRGGERCLEVFCELFPAADLYTLLHVPGSVSPLIERHAIRTSLVQRLPGAATRYRYYLPLFPLAIRTFQLEGYDLVVSLSHCVAKGVRPPPGALHVSYCFSPMRYVWDLYDEYFGPRAGALPRLLMPPVAAALRRWDRASSRGVHHFVAISRHVADRIMRSYGRPADVIYPPVDVDRFTLAADSGGDYYLVVSALVPYKRVDLAVLAARRLGRRLVVVGTGPEAARLRALAGADVEFVGWRSDTDVADLLGRCRALLFPGLEDFGIVPLEAMAAGRPVIAYAAGGALETVVPPGGPGRQFGDLAGRPPTGVLFVDQTVEGLADAILAFEREAGAFVPRALRAHAERFGRPRFKAEVAAYLDARLADAGPC